MTTQPLKNIKKEALGSLLFNKQLGENPYGGDKRSRTIIVDHPGGDPLPYQ